MEPEERIRTHACFIRHRLMKGNDEEMIKENVKEGYRKGDCFRQKLFFFSIAYRRIKVWMKEEREGEETSQRTPKRWKFL